MVIYHLSLPLAHSTSSSLPYIIAYTYFWQFSRCENFAAKLKSGGWAKLLWIITKKLYFLPPSEIECHPSTSFSLWWIRFLFTNKQVQHKFTTYAKTYCSIVASEWANVNKLMAFWITWRRSIDWRVELTRRRFYGM